MHAHACVHVCENVRMHVCISVLLACFFPEVVGPGASD